MKQQHARTSYQKARLQANLTQEQAVEMLPFELRTLQGYESGQYQPKFAAACAMAKLYGCKIEDFAWDSIQEDDDD